MKWEFNCKSCFGVEGQFWQPSRVPGLHGQEGIAWWLRPSVSDLWGMFLETCSECCRKMHHHGLVLKSKVMAGRRSVSVVPWNLCHSCTQLSGLPQPCTFKMLRTLSFKWGAEPALHGDRQWRGGAFPASEQRTTCQMRGESGEGRLWGKTHGLCCAHRGTEHRGETKAGFLSCSELL